MPAGEGDEPNVDDGPRHTLHVSARSVLLVVAAIGLALVTRNIVEKSTRVLGWFAAASVVAALVYPLVGIVARYTRRGLALLLVVLALVGSAGWVGYAAIDEVRSELDHLQEVAPEAARRIEESERYGEAARDFRLEERVRDFVEALPERLAGGDTADVIRSATTRGLAYFVAFILTLFLVIHGPRLVSGGFTLIEAPSRRIELMAIAGRAYHRSVTYLLGTMAIAAASGLYAYVWCRIADLPGATVLAIFVALLSIIPNIGVVIGGLPILLLSFGLDPESGTTMMVLIALVAWQVVDVVFLRRRLVRRSIAIGPAITTVVVMLGVDLYGIGGALVGLALAVFVVALVDELAPTDAHDIDVRLLTG
jgi:predicted PurR-regulated permease PerM